MIVRPRTASDGEGGSRADLRLRSGNGGSPSVPPPAWADPHSDTFGLCGCARGAEAATDYPTRTVRIHPIFGGRRSGHRDAPVAQALTEKWKQSVIIENRPGANTFTGTTAVTPSEPDGYWLHASVHGGRDFTTKRRSEMAPDLPTMEEAGVAGFSSQGAFGLLAPAGVPQHIREKIEADLAEVVQRPEMRILSGRRSDRSNFRR
jgi:tripartite-type tricarboxylate transporter receptor subunit TctC